MGLTGTPDLSCFVDLAHDPALLVSPGLQLVMLTNPLLVTLVCARLSGKWPWWCIKNEELFIHPFLRYNVPQIFSDIDCQALVTQRLTEMASPCLPLWR